MNLYKLVPKDPRYRGRDSYSWCQFVVVAAKNEDRALLADPTWAHHAGFDGRHDGAVLCPLTGTKDRYGYCMRTSHYEDQTWPPKEADIRVILLASDVPINEEGIVCHDFTRI